MKLLLNRKISIAKPNFGKEEEDAVKEVLESGILVSGPRTKSFEKEFAEYIKVEHAVAVTNGTAALDVALKALKIGPGDEVITSAFSFIASGNCILFQNARPVSSRLPNATTCAGGAECHPSETRDGPARGLRLTRAAPEGRIRWSS